jgi:hypothetical protein
LEIIETDKEIEECNLMIDQKAHITYIRWGRGLEGRGKGVGTKFKNGGGEGEGKIHTVDEKTTSRDTKVSP